MLFGFEDCLVNYSSIIKIGRGYLPLLLGSHFGYLPLPFDIFESRYITKPLHIFIYYHQTSPYYIILYYYNNWNLFSSNVCVHVLIMVARGPCSAFDTCFLLLHPGIRDPEHPKTAREQEHMHKMFVIAYIYYALPKDAFLPHVW